MYRPAHFEAPSRDAIQALLRAHPLATLVSQGPEGLTADLVPLEYDAHAGPFGTLRGHVARANPLWQRAEGRPVLALFHGPQGYVSPNWYAGKASDARVVPTWNYAVVHAHGLLAPVHDRAWLRALVGRLTDWHEAATSDRPWAVDDAPADYVERMLGAIVGIEIELTDLVGKWKLSQNRPPADRAGVVAGLQALGPAQAGLAALVQDPDGPAARSAAPTPPEESR